MFCVYTEGQMTNGEPQQEEKKKKKKEKATLTHQNDP